jgi:hypothetical protein
MYVTTLLHALNFITRTQLYYTHLEADDFRVGHFPLRVEALQLRAQVALFCMYVCMCVCMYDTYVYVCMYVCMYVCR